MELCEIVKPVCSKRVSKGSDTHLLSQQFKANLVYLAPKGLPTLVLLTLPNAETFNSVPCVVLTLSHEIIFIVS